jgi:hypothetical protein
MVLTTNILFCYQKSIEGLHASFFHLKNATEQSRVHKKLLHRIMGRQMRSRTKELRGINNEMEDVKVTLDAEHTKYK